MKYAKYIDECTIDENVPRETHDSKGFLVVGDLTTRPELLAPLNFFPLIESEEPEAQDGCHVEKRYAPGNNQVIQTWIQVQDPLPPPKSYSKLKILMAAQQEGFVETLIGFLESSQTIKYIWDASNTIENNELFKQYLPEIASTLGKTEQEVVDFLDEYCVAD